MKLKPFQKKDLARAALHDGLIFSWDTGLGKTWALFLWCLLKVGFTPLGFNNKKVIRPKAPVLIIAPGDLHKQITDEGWNCFKILTTPIESQDAFNALLQKGANGLPQLSPDGRPSLPPGFYITSFSQLTQNGVRSLPDADKWDPHSLLDWLSLKIGAAVPTLTPPKHQDTDPWPDTVAEFFNLRATTALWGTEYEQFRLDYRYCNLLELETAYQSELAALARWPDRKGAAQEAQRLAKRYQVLLNLIPQVIAARRTQLAAFTDLSPAQRTWVIREFCRRKLEEYDRGTGTTVAYPIGEAPVGFNPLQPETDTRTKWKIKCVYSPSLSDLCFNAFDCVAIDEGVKMKGEDTMVGKGIRALDPLYRLVCTATPVKNRLPDIFRLAWWATGGRLDAHARFPYRDDSSEREAFAKTFLVCERNVTKEDKARDKGMNAGGRYRKQTAEVCNIHRLWKLLGPVVLRRRKQDCGEEIVPRIRQVVRCEMGTLQKKVYAYHLAADYRDTNGEKAIGAQLQALRMVAADPSSNHLLEKPGETTELCDCAKKRATPIPSEFPSPPRSGRGVRGEVSSPSLIPRGFGLPRCPRCQGAGTLPLPHRSGTSYIPKTAVTMNLIKDILERGEQVMVFSAFNDPNDNLSRLLHDAGVRHSVLDGRTNQKKRAAAAGTFKRGRFASGALDGPSAVPVMLAGVECMAEGHSFHRCNNVILIAYSWAYDKFKQALDRVHRMNSEKPVNVYVVLCQGTIDRKLEGLVQEKGDAAELVLDGQLMGERQEEVNFAELLQVARDEFNPGEKTVDEALLQSEWPQLRHQLRLAQIAWDNSIAPTLVPASENSTLRTPHSAPVQTSLPEAVLELTPEPIETTPPAPSPALPAAWRARINERAARLRALTQSVELVALF